MRINNFLDRLLGRYDPTTNRRRSPRYPAVANWAFLAWHGGGRTRISPARLLNISGAGSFILARKMPNEGQSARLRLDEPIVTGWVKAKIVRRSGSLKAGLDFLEHCPEEFFQAATQSAPRDAAIPPEFADGHRR
jgi:hypothetical protein